MNEAQVVLERHAQTINDRDLEAYRNTLNYPFTYQNYNGVALTIQSGADLGTTTETPWEIILRTNPNWLRTEFDQIEEVARSASSVVFKVGFRRLDASGNDDGVYHAIWIVTCQQGRWGVQFRHNLGRQICS